MSQLPGEGSHLQRTKVMRDQSSSSNWSAPRDGKVTGGDRAAGNERGVDFLAGGGVASLYSLDAIWASFGDAPRGEEEGPTSRCYGANIFAEPRMQLNRQR
ncbi:hypothetical protein M0657_006942 [Pyricularia oryzae]|uniref:Uncharacterized protein n=1 Tax=Pyricularia oryzae TaxID=318829 RepID=A0A4P7N8Q0_PYROR|nr:hypothetical protein M0657_006942 [Pyricularia oryzae]KAI7919840.1 hypothetical protein M9X92_006142 [Pyricularia oryzae]QBZ56490.1 hypothetical protein PoMZ_01399 [Pyricularia oryzae]